MTKALDKKLELFVEKLPSLDGFIGGWVDEDFGRLYSLESLAQQIKITFTPGGGGHVMFHVDGRGWLTFDRRGVEDSFYWSPLWEGHELPPIHEVLTEMLGRVAAKREYYRGALAVPGIGFTIAPSALESMRKQIKKTGSVTFTPSGFGTGKTVTSRRSRYATRASAELEKFFDHSPLYVESFDAD